MTTTQNRDFEEVFITRKKTYKDEELKPKYILYQKVEDLHGVKHFNTRMVVSLTITSPRNKSFIEDSGGC